MADWFVSSATGANSNSGTVYTAPKKYLWLDDGTAGLFNGASAPAAGDEVFTLDGHAEEPTAVMTMTGGAAAGAALIRIINVASFNSGSPTTLGTARGCVVGPPDSTYTSGRDIRLAPGLDIYGFTFKAADELVGHYDFGTLKLKGCRLQQNRVGTIKLIQLSSTSAGLFVCDFEDVWYKFASSAHEAGVSCAGVKLTQKGGKFETTVNQGFGGFLDGAQVHVSEFDWSNATTFTATSAGGDGSILDVSIKNSYLPATFTIPIEMSNAGQEIVATNCKNAVGSGAEYFTQYCGLVSSETTAVRTGGAEIDGAGYAYEMTPNTRVSEGCPLKCLTITGNADFSTSKTVDIYIANTTRDLTDVEAYAVLSYPTYNAGGNTFASSQGANAVLSATTIADDTTSTWGTSPTYMQKMSITVGGATDGREGPYQITVFLSVDVDVFVDPLPVVV